MALATKYDVAVLIPGMAAWRNILTEKDRSFAEHQEGLPVYREFALPRIPHGPEAISHNTFARAAHNGFRKLVNEWGKPEIIHAHVVLPAGWSALQLGKRYGIPVVLTEHSSPFSMHLGTELSRQLVRETLTQVDQVIAISPALSEELTAFEPGVKIKVVGESVRTDFFVRANNHAIERRPTKRFFVAARLAEQKGLPHLIKAVELLARRGMNSFELVIGGDGPDRMELQNLTKALGVADRCQFIGPLDREQVRKGMQDCDVFVLPSLHETFGVVVGEAMACGKPVIVTRCGGPEFVVTAETGLLVDVANPDALADAMAEFILNQVSFDPATVRASVVNRFGAEAFVQNVTAVYNELW